MSAREKVKTPFVQRLKRARVGALPLLVWVGAAYVAARLWAAGPPAPAFFGLAHSDEVQVTAPLDGRLTAVHVELFDAVAAGAPLASFDPAEIDARVVTARAELAQLAEELRAARATLEAEDNAARQEAVQRHGAAVATQSLEYPAELRAFHADEARLALNILDTRLALTTSAYEADRVELRLTRAEALTDRRIGPEADADDLRQLLAKERARAADLRTLVSGIEGELEATIARRRALEDSYVPPPVALFTELALEARLAGWRAALVVQEKRLDELAVERANFIVRAPVAGRVALLSVSAGQFVTAGEALLALLDPAPSEVALWVPESAPYAPLIGERLLVARALDPLAVNGAVECGVRVAAPGLELMPQRLWRDARFAEYGRAYRIGPLTDLRLVPGERVRIDVFAE